MTSQSSNHICEKSELLGNFQNELQHLQSGMKRANDIIDSLSKDINSHTYSNINQYKDIISELKRVREILTTQTDRVTEIMNVTAVHAQWFEENGTLIENVESHETRLTKLEHNRTFIKGAAWVMGIFVTVFGIAPIIKRLVEWLMPNV